MSEVDWPPVADERVVWAGQPRQRVVLQGLLVGLAVGLVVAVGAVAAVVEAGVAIPTAALAGVPLAVLGVVVPTGAVWLWRRTTRYALTESAIYHRTGVLSITVTELSLRKVQNTAYDQSALGVVFGHGTVTVDTASSDGAELTLRALDGPAAVHRQLATQVKDTQGQADLPGTLDQWRAVRAETRRVRRLLAEE